MVAEAAQTDLEQEQLNNGFPESNKSRFYQDWLCIDLPCQEKSERWPTLFISKPDRYPDREIIKGL